MKTDNAVKTLYRVMSSHNRYLARQIDLAAYEVTNNAVKRFEIVSARRERWMLASFVLGGVMLGMTARYCSNQFEANREVMYEQGQGNAVVSSGKTLYVVEDQHASDTEASCHLFTVSELNSYPNKVVRNLRSRKAAHR